MLMSFSWVCFLVGYELYLLTPLISRDSSLTEGTVRCGSCPTIDHTDLFQIAVVATIVGATAMGIFFVNAGLSRLAIARLKEVDRPAMVSTAEVGAELAVPKS